MSKTVQNISVTGGANTATNVTYNNDASGLNAENAQDAIDEISNKLIYDVSACNNGAVFKSLQSLLSSSNLSTLIPTSVRHGGMSIRFIQGSEQSSDNKYVQARCMAQNFSTDITQWQGVDETPTAGSQNLVTSGGVVGKLGNITGIRVIDGNYSIKSGTKFCNILVGETINADTICHLKISGVSLGGIALIHVSSIVAYLEAKNDTLFYAEAAFNYIQVRVPSNVSSDTSIHVELVINSEFDKQDNYINQKYSLDNINSIIGAKEIVPTYTKTTGKFIKVDDGAVSIKSESGYFYSSAISVKAGDFIFFRHLGQDKSAYPAPVKSTVSIITLVDENDVPIKCLVQGNSNTNIHSCYIEEDGYIAISNVNDGITDLTIYQSANNENIYKSISNLKYKKFDNYKYINVFDDNSLWEDGYNYINSRGELAPDTTGKNIYKASKRLEIKQGEPIFIFGIWGGAANIYEVAFYDTSGSFLSSLSYNPSDNNTWNRGKIIPTTDSSIKYVRFCVRRLTGDFRGYCPIIHTCIYAGTITKQQYIDSKKEESSIYNKVIAYFGDSITAGANVQPVNDGTVRPYPYLIYDEVKALPCIFAVPGGYFSYAANEYSIPYQTTLVRQTPDIIVIEGGVNDYSVNRAFGSIDYGSSSMYSDTLQNTTFCGGLEQTFRNLVNEYPRVPKLYIIATKARDYEWKANTKGQTYRDYVDEIVKCCKKYGIKCLNLHDESDLVPQIPEYHDNSNFTYSGDNLHPTTDSYKKFYVNRIIKELEAIVRI